MLKKERPPAITPVLNTDVRLVAQLGGFLARKRDGEPGGKTLWLGLRDLVLFVQDIPLSRQQARP